MEQNLSSYRAFYTVATTGNISHAANELYISQPAISKSIRKLEESLGVPLFFRTSKGVSLTEEGALLYSHVKKAFEELNQGEEHLRMFREFGMGQLSIGVSSTLCKYVLLPQLNQYIQQHPHVHVTIDCQSSNQTLRMLEQEQIDIGLIGIDRPLKDFAFQSVGKIHDIFVSSPSYLSNLQILSPADTDPADGDTLLSSATLMLLDKKNLTRRFMDSYFTENHIHPQHTLEVTTMDLLIEFAKVGLGIACVIREFVQEELSTGELIEIPLNISIPQREIGYAYLDEKLGRTARQFLG